MAKSRDLVKEKVVSVSESESKEVAAVESIFARIFRHGWSVASCSSFFEQGFSRVRREQGVSKPGPGVCAAHLNYEG